MNVLSFYKESFQGLPIEIWYLSAVMLVNRAGSMVLPFLSLYVTSELGFDMSIAGYILAFYGIGSIVGAWIGGYLTDRIGPLEVQIGSLLLSALMFCILTQMTSLWSFSICLMLTSTCTDAFRPANMASIGIFATQKLRIRSVGLIRLAINLGYSIGPAAGGLIAGTFGYNSLFIVDAITCAMAAGLLYHLFKGRSFESDGSHEAESNETVNPWQDKPYLLFIGLTLLSGVIFLQLIYTLPVYYEESLNYSEAMIGGLLAINGLMIAVIEMPLIHYLSDRGDTFKLLGWGIVMIGAGFLMLIFGQSILWPLACMLLLTVGEILNLPFGTTAVLDRSPARGRGQYMSVYNMTFSACTIITPILGLAIAETYGFQMLWISVFVASLFVTIGYQLVGELWRS